MCFLGNDVSVGVEVKTFVEMDTKILSIGYHFQDLTMHGVFCR